MDRNKDPLHEPIYFDGYKDGCYVEIAMQYNKDVYVENFTVLQIIYLRPREEPTLPDLKRP